MEGLEWPVAQQRERRFVWLACQSHAAATAGNRDVPSDVQLFFATKMKKLLEAAPSLVEQLNEFMPSEGRSRQPRDVRNQYHKQVSALSQYCSKKIVGLAIVEVASAYEGVFSLLDFEQRCVLRLMASGADTSQRIGSVFLRVCDAAALREPQWSVVAGVKAYANHKSFVMTHQSIQNLLSSPLISSETVEQRVEDWVFMDEYEMCVTSLDESDPGPMCAIVLPPQVALLVAHGFLSNVAFLPSSRFVPCPYLDPVLSQIRSCRRDSAANGAARDFAALESDCVDLAEGGVDREMLLGMADSLRMQLQQLQSREAASAEGSDQAAAAAAAALQVQQLTLQRQIVWVGRFFTG